MSGYLKGGQPPTTAPRCSKLQKRTVLYYRDSGRASYATKTMARFLLVALVGIVLCGLADGAAGNTVPVLDRVPVEHWDNEPVTNVDHPAEAKESSSPSAVEFLIQWVSSSLSKKCRCCPAAAGCSEADAPLESQLSAVQKRPSLCNSLLVV